MTTNAGLNAASYQSTVIRLYLDLPDTPSRASPQDIQVAALLHARAVPLMTVESALLLASLRRRGRSNNLPALSPIRSLAYFFPVIQELLDRPLPYGYRDYLREKLQILKNNG
jgi:hypothetical protein